MSTKQGLNEAQGGGSGLNDMLCVDAKTYETGLCIANVLMALNTDFRGEALKVASERLAKNAQGFTAKVILDAAKSYGYRDA